MAWLALAVVAAWVVLVGVARAILHARAGGAPPVRLRDPAGAQQWWARVLGSVGFGLALLAPMAELAGLPAMTTLDRVEVRLAGLGLAAVGIAGTLHAQVVLGASWRGDVDPEPGRSS